MKENNYTLRIASIGRAGAKSEEIPLSKKEGNQNLRAQKNWAAGSKRQEEDGQWAQNQAQLVEEEGGKYIRRRISGGKELDRGCGAWLGNYFPGERAKATERKKGGGLFSPLAENVSGTREKGKL